jgi:ubiquitin C-terminal hydrolase
MVALFCRSNFFCQIIIGEYISFVVQVNFDDEDVRTVVDEADIVTDAAYILFYRRRPTI